MVLEPCSKCTCTCHRDLSWIVEGGDVSVAEDKIDGAAVLDAELTAAATILTVTAGCLKLTQESSLKVFSCNEAVILILTSFGAVVSFRPKDCFHSSLSS